MNTSKEFLATVVGVVAILAFLWNISVHIGGIERELGAIKAELGEVRGTVEANSQAITVLRGNVEEVRKDVREIRGTTTAHLQTHAKHAMLSGVPEAKTQ
ncbi:MAG: hypothetical protein HAW59_00675 [Betaproteobacteria bacterium]|nr:hypothetical protein [Betaproteobacteria bacterium]